MTIQQRGFGRPLPQAVEALVVQAHQGMNARVGGIRFDEIAVRVFTIVIIFSPQAAHHQLERPGEVVHAEDIVLNVIVGLLHAAEVAAIEGEVTAQRIVPFHVVDATTGTGQEHHVGIQPVNIKVIAVEAFTCPEGTALQRAGEIREIAQLRKGLTNIEIAGIS